MQILTPHCPVCDQPPAISEPWLATWFCGNDDCTAFTWDPTKSLDELLMNAGQVKITLTGNQVAEHRPWIRPGTNPGGLYARAVSVEEPTRVVTEHPITDLNAASSADSANDQVQAWLDEHPTDEVHVYVYDGDSGRCVQTIVVSGEQVVARPVGELQDQVVVDGRTLYAPLFACRPINVVDWPEQRQRVWQDVIARVGEEPDVYPGSTVEPCDKCRVRVAVGPRQQEARSVANGVGLAVHVLCVLCAAEHPGAAAMHLDNPHE